MTGRNARILSPSSGLCSSCSISTLILNQIADLSKNFEVNQLPMQIIFPFPGQSDRVDRTLLRRHLCGGRGIVVEHGGEPFFRFLRAPALAPRVILDLIPFDLADAEIVALRVAEIEPAHLGARRHGEALRELTASRGLTVGEISNCP